MHEVNGDTKRRKADDSKALRENGVLTTDDDVSHLEFWPLRRD